MRYEEWAAIGHANGWLGVRSRDGITSREGARSIALRAGSQRVKLLEAYNAISHMFWADGLIDDEAGYRSGLAQNPKCGYWKRCSELRQAGYIYPTGKFRTSTKGVRQQVCKITDAGKEALRALAASR